jgi:hypothetical protein
MGSVAYFPDVPRTCRPAGEGASDRCARVLLRVASQPPQLVLEGPARTSAATWASRSTKRTGGFHYAPGGVPTAIWR